MLTQFLINQEHGAMCDPDRNLYAEPDVYIRNTDPCAGENAIRGRWTPVTYAAGASADRSRTDRTARRVGSGRRYLTPTSVTYDKALPETQITQPTAA